MKNLTISLFVVLYMVMTGCDKSEVNTEVNTGLTAGHWIRPTYTDNSDGKTYISYEKSDTFSVNSEGIQFLNDGTLIERKNASFCGTPPIIYADYSGNWLIQNDSVIIDVAYWGGMEHRVWKIIRVTNASLKIEVASSEATMDL
ncbi:MAG: hypothetical protein FWF53_08425 [Candidatus Azobacteroides sp.]|nr:hypothetical protein [Candidatus Azobacteroides sp.]